ncbi:ZP domain-containing protein [Strongylocentrotus purpuratus]|uniref:ZP domain-containing protein n=1 Tax=Strongylocentrotus purpuratus TaxID=7668 RepID=A0A7M7HP71_STRPU|nr:ZP domain-containing protein [Strongylocentrotus purpuratus]|eukprot:XP_011679718.1 PREDICTED: ZP domain-containing protein-like [Strongylocentrotus purpuratus]
MTVTIPLTLVGGTMNGEDLHLLGDDDCTGMISEDTRFISIATNLTDCNNAITEDDEHIVYSNTVVTRESEGTITRLKQVTVPFYCSYNRSEQVGLRSYRVTDYQLNFTEVSTGRYKFALDIFKDDDFEEKYADSEYPVDVNLDEELYFGASVPSQDGALDLSIRSCVATPSASYNDEQWTIIRDGCAFETSTHIDDGALGFVAVTINTFRFVELGNRVYIHCDLLVCQATTGNETSECDPGCVGSSGNRDRRDIVEKYSLDKKRITKGPLRLRRNSYFNPSLNDMFNSEENPAFHYDFNPWIVVTVALATICIIIVVMLSVMLRKMTSYARRMKPVCVGDEACEALLGLKTNL